ncbi:MAG: (Fe-S)-binding protein [Betaproteobacteria bacterium]|nr:(Fe-S)-binding protein [Betaproteobacteria bacterium]
MKKRVGLFITCLADVMRPSIPMAAVELLESAHFEVHVPMAQTCCGQPAYNSGDHRTTLALAEKFLDEFESFDYVVAPSGSCMGTIKTHYPDVLKDQPDLLRRFAAIQPRLFELTDFLVRVALLTEVPGAFEGEVTYHDSCSGLRELGIKQQPRQLLSLVPGLSLCEMEQCEQCCGFGGTFAVKYGNISAAIADDKCANIQATKARAVVLGDLGCMMQIEGRLRRQGDNTTQVLHIAEVLSGKR